jgi:hypothetical protein
MTAVARQILRGQAMGRVGEVIIKPQAWKLIAVGEASLRAPPTVAFQWKFTANAVTGWRH